MTSSDRVWLIQPRATCTGADAPQWSLGGFFIPASPRFGESYGLDAFDGTVTLVSLHTAWCGYCRTQAIFMEQMLGELRAEGYEVEFITVNKIDAADEGYQQAMIYQLGSKMRSNTMPMVNRLSLHLSTGSGYRSGERVGTSRW